MRRSFKFDACVHENHSSYNSISDFCEHIGIPALVECLLQGMQYFVSHIKGTTLHCSRWHLAIPKKSSSPGAVMKLAYRRMSLIVEALQILRQVLQGVRADLSFGYFLAFLMVDLFPSCQTIILLMFLVPKSCRFQILYIGMTCRFPLHVSMRCLTTFSNIKTRCFHQ